MWKRWLALILVLTPVFSFPQNPSASLSGDVRQCRQQSSG